MKALKKTLCLVLVLVMAFGLLGVSASAANKITYYGEFKDADTITYTEAVDVMVRLGIIEGRETGYFDTFAIVNRAEAAKIITYLILGQEEADKLTATSDPFKDVPKDTWYAGYVAFCARQGLVDGYGDGNFGPADKLTAYQFAKMLLCAIGYGAVDEFVGQFWYVNVYKLAVSKGIFTVPGVDYNAGATREQTVVYAFNALSKVPQVSYVPVLTDYVYKHTLQVIASDDENVEASLWTLGWEYYGLYAEYGYVDWVGPRDQQEFFDGEPGMYLLSLTAPVFTPAGGTDVFDSGLRGHVWRSEKGVVSDFVNECTLIATTYDIVEYFGGRNKFYQVADGYQFTVNGQVLPQGVGPFEYEVADFGAETDLSEPNAYRGVKVQVYTHETGKLALAFVQGALEAESKLFTGVNTQGVPTIRIDGITEGYEPAADYVGYENIKQGDVVLDTWMDNYVDYLEITKGISGTKSLYNITTATLTFAGKAYQVSGQPCWIDGGECIADLVEADALDELVIYLDQGGYIIHVDYAPGVAPDLAIATGRYGLKVETTLGGTNYFEAELVSTEAEPFIAKTEYLYGVPTAVYDIFGRYVPSEFAEPILDGIIASSGVLPHYKHIFVNYDDLDNDGEIEMWPANPYGPIAYGTLITADQAQIDSTGIYGNEDTVYIIRSVDENGTVTYTKYVGCDNIPAALVYDVIMRPVGPGAAVARYVYAEAIYIGPSAEFLVLSTDPVQVVYPEGGGYYYLIRVWMGGAETLIGVEDPDDFMAGYYYIIEEITGDNGEITWWDVGDPEYTVPYTYVGGGVMIVDGVEKRYTANTVVYLCNGANQSVMATLGVDNAMSNDDAMRNGIAYVTYTADGRIKEIYVGVADNPAP